jgi:hypothetical protein
VCGPLLLEIVKSMSLPESLYERLEGHYSAIGELLCDSQHPALQDLQIFPQWSVLTRTLVRPLPGKDADVDGVAFKKDGIHLSPWEWLDCLLAELKSTAIRNRVSTLGLFGRSMADIFLRSNGWAAKYLNGPA